VVIFDADGGRENLPMLTKREVAERILDRLVRRLADRDAGALDGRRVAAQTGMPTQESRS
jgi:hypothetical protein